MACLGAINYNPATSVSASTAAAIAMTALDTTNLRISFTAPSNGAVLVRLRGNTHGSASGFPRIHLGVLEGTTVRLRGSPMGMSMSGAATTHMPQEVVAVVPGLTPGNTYIWDAAYSVDVVMASTGLKYGGPNDVTGNNAFGAFQFEVWEATNLLGACLYDPAAAVTLATVGLIAMTAMDTTNLRITFTAPANGQVMWRIRTCTHAAVTQPMVLLGILDGSTVRAVCAPIEGCQNALLSGAINLDAQGVITGLTPGNSYTWDAAYDVETVGTNGIKYGGPNDATAGNAFGAAQFEIWRA